MQPIKHNMKKNEENDFVYNFMRTKQILFIFSFPFLYGEIAQVTYEGYQQIILHACLTHFVNGLIRSKSARALV